MNSDSTPAERCFGAPLAGGTSPLTRTEYITAMVHFYRAEMHRSTLWRMRLDTTTNWAILTTTAVVTYSFGQAEHSHASLLVGMIMVLTFLSIEARRFRILAVWRERTRTLERNFIAPVLLGQPVSIQPNWNQELAEELYRPDFTMTRLQAIRGRLESNYLPLFGLLLLCWLIKVRASTEGEQLTWGTWIDGMRVGLIPGTVVGGFVAVLYAALVVVGLTSRQISSEEDLFHDAQCPEC